MHKCCWHFVQVKIGWPEATIQLNLGSGNEDLKPTANAKQRIPVVLKFHLSPTISTVLTVDSSIPKLPKCYTRKLHLAQCEPTC